MAALEIGFMRVIFRQSSCIRIRLRNKHHAVCIVVSVFGKLYFITETCDGLFLKCWKYSPTVHSRLSTETFFLCSFKRPRRRSRLCRRWLMPTGKNLKSYNKKTRLLRNSLLQLLSNRKPGPVRLRDPTIECNQ